MRVMAYHSKSGLALGIARDGRIFALNKVLGWENAIAALHDEGGAFRQGDAVDALPALPVSKRSKILCVGVNYADHAAEGKIETPKFPNFFTRYHSSLVADGEDLVLPRVSAKYDYEAELVIVIGRAARHVPKDRALDYVFGYTVGMDGSVRDYQKRTSQFTLGKNFDGSGALGSVIVTADELPPGAAGLGIRGLVNGAVMQDGNTGDMVFDTAALVSVASEAMQLNPGDVIFTGTPAGVGFARTPPVFLKDGDRVDIEIEGIGRLSNRVRAEI